MIHVDRCLMNKRDRVFSKSQITARRRNETGIGGMVFSADDLQWQRCAESGDYIVSSSCTHFPLVAKEILTETETK